jgi:thioredoxin 1
MNMKILKFSASWCGPCKQLAFTLASMGDLGVPVEEVDVDENAELTEKYAVRGVPTMVLVGDDGLEMGRLVGAASLIGIREWLDPKVK